MLKSLRVALLTVGALFAVGAFAQPAYDDGPAGSANEDPPSRVGRLSFIHGAVSFVPAGENDWVEAQLNRPLITGDKLWTDRDSHAELEVGPATIRIDEQTSFDFLNLDDNTAQVELTEGALNLHVRRLYDNQVYEIDTPTLAFVINRVGEYRISVEPDGLATVVTVIQGGGDAYGEDSARFRVEEGQSVTFNDSSLRDYYTDSLPPPDAFDGFVHERDTRWERSRSREYVSEDVIGYSDLDEYGDWDDVPEYGHVWYPTSVSVGWTPYHNGHWGWVGSYGWTWIDDAPWGFAPFHYGRWAYVGNRWGWCPGPRSVRPYYAPALVAFIGGGVSVGVSIGGPVGWFPLGPRDVYFPGYRVSQRYFTQVNVSNTVVNTTVINNYYGNYRNNNVDFGRVAYANRNIAGAVTAVPATAFVNARPVAQAAVAVNRTTFANARVTSFAAVAPTRASLVSATARQASARPPQAVMDRRIVAASRPAPAVASFASREAMLKKNPGQPLDRTQLRARPVELPGAAANNAANARGGAGINRQNIKVVTNTGAPVRTAAPVLTARPRAEGDNRGRRAVGPATAPDRGNAPANAANDAAQRGANDRRGNVDRAVGNDRQPANANQGNQGQRLRSSDFVRGGNRGNAAQDNAPNPQQQQQQVERGRDANADRGRGREVNGAQGDATRAVQDRGARDAQQQNQQREREAAQQQTQQRDQVQRQRDQQAQQQGEREKAQQQNQQREQGNQQREQQAQRQRDAQQQQQQREQGNQQREQQAQREAQQQQQQQREQGNQQREQQAQRQRDAQQQQREQGNQQREQQAQREAQQQQREQASQQREQAQRQREAQQQQQQQREQAGQQQAQQAQRQREAQQQQQQQREQANQQRDQQIQQQREQAQRQREAQQQQQQQQQQQRQPPPQQQQQRQAPPPQNQGNRGDNRTKEQKKKDKEDNGGG